MLHFSRSSPVSHLALVLITTMSAVAACGRADGDGSRRPRGPVTFTKDVAPIVFKHCTPCHSPGQGAPFPLLTYQDVKARARMIATLTERRQMPPWQPEPGFGSFSNERRLPDDQIAVIAQWVREGAVEGDPVNPPVQPQDREGWRFGQPDLVVELPRPYTLPAESGDVFRNFVIPLALGSTRYVRAVEFHPRIDRAVVHHAVIGIDGTGTARRLDAQDAEPGYDDMLSRGEAQGPEGHFLSWTPGKEPFIEPADMSWRLEPGTDLVIQLHLVPSGRPETIRPVLGLLFSNTPPTREPVLIKLGSKAIDIQPGDANYTITDSYELPVDVDVLSVYPHAHYLARDLQAFAKLPNGSTTWLIWIKSWNFNLQDEYRYRKPVRLPKGSIITMRYTYDNSIANLRNPHQPPQRVGYGPHSTDEMGDLWLQAVPATKAAAALVARDHAERELRANLAGADTMVRAKPRDSEALNWLGTSYLRAGRVEDAVGRLEEALRIKPDSAEVHYNLGSALQAQGRLADALGHLRAAARLNSNDDRIQLTLADVLNASGAVGEAMQHYRAALVINPESAEAHNNLGIVLGSQGAADEATRHFEQALVIRPHYADAHNNLGIAYASRGQLDAAAAHFRRALQLAPDDPNARQNLQALLGRDPSR
jgi:tetratricopeptide (TPR) repeat protein